MKPIELIDRTGYVRPMAGFVPGSILPGIIVTTGWRMQSIELVVQVLYPHEGEVFHDEPGEAGDLYVRLFTALFDHAMA